MATPRRRRKWRSRGPVLSISIVYFNLSPYPLLHVFMASAYRASLQDAEAFWLPIAHRLLTWERKPKRAVEVSSPTEWRWFPDGQLNVCYNAVDRHPAGRTAIIYDSPVTGVVQHITYAELLEQVCVVAGMLRGLDVMKSDTVLLYMPMIPQALVCMLACARLGAVACVVFGGFASAEVAKRMEDARPKVVMTASCGVEPKRVIPYAPLVAGAVEQSAWKPSHLVVYQRPGLPPFSGIPFHDYTQLYEETRRLGREVRRCVMTASNDPFYILYTSGTTGKPKGVLRECGGHAVAKAFTMEYLFGLRPGQVIFCASDIGWVVGHSYIVYAPLLAGVTTVLFEGKPVGTLHGAGVFWRMCQQHAVSVLFCAPTALRAIRREDPKGEQLRRYDLRKLRAVFLAGERSEPGIVEFYQKLLQERSPGALVIDNYWSTESGSPKTGVPLGAPDRPLPQAGSAGPPMPGMQLCIVDDEGTPLPDGEPGNIVMQTPLGPSAFTTLWRNQRGFYDAYFARFHGRWYDTGDSGFINPDNGFVNVMARSDDIINIAAHRLSTGAIEEVLASHPAVSEVCVVGMPDTLKGHVPLAFAVSSTERGMFAALNALVRERIGGIASLGGVVLLPPGGIPKTRSGKTLRRVLRALTENATVGAYEREVAVPATVEDMAAVDIARKAIRQHFEAKAKL